VTPVEALLHRASYHAEKPLKRRGNFNSVLWITEYADSRREMRETWCDNAPTEASVAEILTTLATEMRAEFAGLGVACFAVAYLANRVTTSRPVEQRLLLVPAAIRRPVVIMEAHSLDEHWRAERDSSRARRGWGAMTASEPATESLYAGVLQRASDKRTTG
jgi:hypothetical protein